jgi:hypothetical protein
MNNKKDLVRAILERLSETQNRPLDKKGNLDVEAFNNLPETKKAIKELKLLKITKKWLWRNGFMSAGMLLRI